MTHTSSSPIKAYRERNGSPGRPLSYEGFGKVFGVDKTTARYWEQKRVPAERVVSIAKLIGCRPSDLRPDVFPPGHRA